MRIRREIRAIKVLLDAALGGGTSAAGRDPGTRRGGNGGTIDDGAAISPSNLCYWLKTRALTTWPFCQPWACRDPFSLRILPI